MKAASAIWSLVSVLIGALIGAYIAERIQRKRESLNSKKEEYRELLSVLTQASNTIAEFYGPVDPHSPEEERAYYEAKEKALITIDNRLFITSEIEKMNLRRRWISAVHDVENGGPTLIFRQIARQILRQITSAAKHLIE